MTVMVDGAADSPPSRCKAQRLVDAHFQGRVTPTGERRMREHLGSCATCRARYHRHLHLAAVDPAAAIPARVRLARGLGLPRPARAPASRRWAARAVPALALGLCAVVAIGLSRSGAPELQSRGVRPLGQLLVYEVPKHGAIIPVSSWIHRDSGLAFAYANVSRKNRLLVFAVDDGRRVYWYHPAWTDARDNPIGVMIARDNAVHELPQAITHPLSGRRLQLFGVFSDRVMSVRDVEAAVSHAPADEQGRLRLVVPGAEVTRLDLALSGGE